MVNCAVSVVFLLSVLAVNKKGTSYASSCSFSSSLIAKTLTLRVINCYDTMHLFLMFVTVASVAVVDSKDGDLWPSGIIPYRIQTTGFSRKEQQMIKRAIEQMEQKTCLNFTTLTEKRNHISFEKSSGEQTCGASTMGYHKYVPKHMLFLRQSCIKVGTIQHEVMHVLGFGHEHQRRDRSGYIRLLEQNIDYSNYSYRRVYRQLIKRNSIEVDKKEQMKLPYDFASIMHYPLNQFGRTKSGKQQPTIEIKWRVKLPQNVVPKSIGYRRRLSVGDIAAINAVYKSECRRREQGEEQKKGIRRNRYRSRHTGTSKATFQTQDPFAPGFHPPRADTEPLNLRGLGNQFFFKSRG